MVVVVVVPVVVGCVCGCGLWVVPGLAQLAGMADLPHGC